MCSSDLLINHAKVVLEGNVTDIRRSHSKHLYDIHLCQDAPPAPVEGLFNVESCAPGKAGGIDAEIRLCEGVAKRDAIAFINSRYELAGFSEKLPTMNEVFIETVQQNKEVER